MNLDPGDEFTAEVMFITNDGLATAYNGEEEINVGYVTCDTGTELPLQYLGTREQFDNDVHYAICLNEDVLASNNDQWVRGIMDTLIPDAPPDVGQVSYAEIDDIDDRNLGVTVLGDTRVQLGPVRAEPGTLVRIIGAPNNCAEVRTMSARGDNYETRFKILSQQYNELPVAQGDEITTTISEFDNDRPVGYVGEVPIRFSAGTAELAQKVEGRIHGSDRDMLLGEITETHDEVGRIEEASHWARMQWLENAGFGSDPLRSFAKTFIGVPSSALPERDDLLRDALIAEAIRLGIQDKVQEADSEYPTTHISGLRHWVVHKLAAVLGEPRTRDETDSDDAEAADNSETNWFRSIMNDRLGPTMTFYGDVLQLSEGYYAPAPTRAVMMNPASGAQSTAVLVSSDPSERFLEAGFSLQIRGIARVVHDTSAEELAAHDIPTQSIASYTGLDQAGIYTEADLVEFIDAAQPDRWQPSDNWEPYTGHRYGFQRDGSPRVATIAEGLRVSLYRVPVEYGTDAYQLKLERGSDTDPEMIGIPSHYRKPVSLVIDAASGRPQQVDITARGDDVVLTCDFAPPRPQMRWLHAVGAQWIDSPRYKLQWQIPPESVDSVTDVFGELPVSINTADSSS